MDLPYFTTALARVRASHDRLRDLGRRLARSASLPEDHYDEEIHRVILFLLCCLFAKNTVLEKVESDFLNAWLQQQASCEENANAINYHLEHLKPEIPTVLNAALAHDAATGETLAARVLEDLWDIATTASMISGDSPYTVMGDALNYLSILRSHAAREKPAAYPKSFTNTSQSGSALPLGTRTSLPLPESLDALLAQLDCLIGLARVKKEVRTLANLIRIQKLREEQGLKTPPMSHHLVFSGNPGTGKTTVARLLGKIYRSLGLLPKGHLVETDRAGMVAGYMGQTAIRVQEIVSKAQGGVLFIDEAYSLCSGKSEEDYGFEAIDTLLKLMEDHRDKFIVIVAGYTEKMEEFLASNPGLQSRFNKFIPFDDYSPQELYDIFVKFCGDGGYCYANECALAAAEHFKQMHRERGGNFANARTVRNYFERAIANHANRVALIACPSVDDLQTLQAPDLPGTL